ncbi:hypothetical protein MKEN_01463600 [Mycena kentingensis (nom. inval.)]|nr:hypothetical protein MKEN_01463600 [Mycena kentingensis (nom. inval.)]
MFFNVFNVLVLLCVCAHASAMRLHTPGRHHNPRVALQETGTIPISWSGELSDPPQFSLLVMNLIGGTTERLDGVYEPSAEGLVNIPISVGTFQVYAVDPDDDTRVFDSTRQFSVLPKGGSIDMNGGASFMDGFDASRDGADDTTTLSMSLTSPNSIPSSATASSAPSTTAPAMKPVLIGGIVAGAVLLLLLLGLVIFFAIRRHRANSDVARRTTFHRSRMVRPAGDHEKGLGSGPADLEKEFPMPNNASIPNPYIGAYGYAPKSHVIEFDDVSIEGSAISISDVDTESRRATTVLSSYASSSYAQSTRMEPERYVADLKPQRYNPENAPVYPFGSPPKRG